MTAEPLELQRCAAAFAVSPLPVWVIDVRSLFVLWANDAALRLWRVATREELYARDLLAGAPAKVLARLHDAIAQVLRDELLCEEWVFYPGGQPTPALLHLRKIRLADGRDAMLNQVAPIEATLSDSLLRAVTAMRHLSTPVAYVGDRGDIRMKNPAAMEEFGDADAWPSWFVDADAAHGLLRAAHAGDAVRVEARVRGRHGERWHAIEAHALRDPVVGDLGVLVMHRDETARLAAEQAAHARLLVVEAQRREIVSLSAPILSVGAETLAVPIIGRLDDERSRDIMDRLLAAIAARRTRRVILDLTGVVEVAEAGSGGLRSLCAAIRLLGAAPVLTGVSAVLAQSLAQSGHDLGDVQISRSLAEALQPRP